MSSQSQAITTNISGSVLGAMEYPIYVGTYRKYNNGDLSGQWLDAANYSDRDDFLEACKELHSDESDPELMFQDFDIPHGLAGECFIADEFWDYIELCDQDRELVDAYLYDVLENFEYDSLEKAEDARAATGVSYLDAAMEYAENCLDLDINNDILWRYFDYEAYAKDRFSSSWHNGTCYLWNQ